MYNREQCRLKLSKIAEVDASSVVSGKNMNVGGSFLLV